MHEEHHLERHRRSNRSRRNEKFNISVVQFSFRLHRIRSMPEFQAWQLVLQMPARLGGKGQHYNWISILNSFTAYLSPNSGLLYNISASKRGKNALEGHALIVQRRPSLVYRRLCAKIYSNKQRKKPWMSLSNLCSCGILEQRIKPLPLFQLLCHHWITLHQPVTLQMPFRFPCVIISSSPASGCRFTLVYITEICTSPPSWG